MTWRVNSRLLDVFQHWVVLAFASGFVGSLLATQLVVEIDRRHRWHAAGLEILAILVAIIGWQLWAQRDNDWRVLLIEGIGTVLGTWLVLS